MTRTEEPLSPRTTLRRHAERADTRRATLLAILDEAPIVHVGLSGDRAPMVLPMAHGRIGDRLFLHGARANALLSALAQGTEACVTATLVDGLVVARSAFHHSMNYRSAVVFGRLEEVTGEVEKRRALDAILEHTLPGRASETRPPTDAELRATRVLSMSLNEASAKVRRGPPVDNPADEALPYWAGIVPLRQVAGLAETTGSREGAVPEVPIPRSVERAVLTRAAWGGDTHPLHAPKANGPGADGPEVGSAAVDRAGAQGSGLDCSAPGSTDAGSTDAGSTDARSTDAGMVELDTTRARLDVDVVLRWLRDESYWAPGLTRGRLVRAIQGSICVGAYGPDGSQWGFARVVTDHATFAWLCDVFVDRSQRGRGIASAMVRHLRQQPELGGLRRWMLGTRDAHGLYELHGFEPLREAHRFMAIELSGPPDPPRL